VTGILDWEYACVAPPLWELAYVFGCWLFVLDDLTRTIELTCQFLAGYCREIPLPATELGRIPELYRWFRLNHMGMFYNHYVLGDHRTDAFLAGNIRQINMVEAIGPDLEAEIIRRLGPAQ
jgi:Ser/Thr protein kinase RdoA (MazF antagonist)